MKVKLTVPNDLILGNTDAEFKFTLKEAKVVGEFVMGEIRERTQAGKSVSGKRFASYKPSYLKYRQKHERRSRVNLTFTGAMLGSCNVRKASLVNSGGSFGGFRVAIGPSATQMPNYEGAGTRPPNNFIAYVLQYGTKHMLPRPWLGLPKKGKVAKDVALIMGKMIEEKWKKGANKKTTFSN